MISKMIEVIHVREEKFPCDVRRNIGPVHVNFFILAIIGAEPDDVAFICGNEDQFILAEKSKDRRIGLSRPVAGFDGKCKALAIAEIETHNGVAYPLDSPIDEEKISAANIRKIERPVAPTI